MHSLLANMDLQLYAFERDKRRFETLKMMLRKAQCKNVETVNADFLTIDPADVKFANVTHMYVSHILQTCWLSIIRFLSYALVACLTHHAVAQASSTDSITYLSLTMVSLFSPSLYAFHFLTLLPLFLEEEETENNDDRLQKLASFQLMMIRHAMKCMYFPP